MSYLIPKYTGCLPRSNSNAYQVGDSNVHIGSNAGLTNQGNECVSIGYNSGYSNQGNQSIAIGVSSGAFYQGGSSVSIGINSGQTSQGTRATAIGRNSGLNNQGVSTVAVGDQAGQSNQGQYAVAIGQASGYQSQGGNSISIGQYAGFNNQYVNSIILNATGNELDATSSGFFVAPLENIQTNNILYYNTNTSEITYSSPIRLLNQSISNAVVASWNNGAMLTIPANNRFQVSVIIATDYNPAYSVPNPSPWTAFSISLYTASRYYGLTMGDPTTTSNFIYSQVSPTNSPLNPTEGVTNIQATCNISDFFDLSSDSATSCNIAFYFVDWDNTNINTLNYSVIITPV